MKKTKIRKAAVPVLDKRVEPRSSFDAKAVALEDLLRDESLWDNEETARSDAAFLMSLFSKEDWVFITADLLASNFSMPWPRVMKSVVVDGRASGMPIENHKVQALIEDPALYADAQSFWYVAGVFDCMVGNTIMWYMPANEKFMIIPSHEVSIEFDKKKNIPKEYVWSPSGNSKSKVSFPADEIVHVRRPNPNSQFWGLSPFIPADRSVLFNRYSGEFLNSFFEKGATPQMVVETEISNNKEAIATLAKSFELVNGGRKNQRRPLVLPKGAKVTQINMTIADTKLYDFVNQNREVILNILRIPKHAVGLQTAGSLGSEEHKTALRFMWASTVNPMLKRYSTALTKFFQRKGMLKKDEYIEFDSSDIEIANEDMNSRADFAIKISKTHTINEVRRIVWGEPPIEGGDFIPGVMNDPYKKEGGTKPPNDGGEQPAPETLPPPVQPPEAMPTAKFSRISELVGSENFAEHTKDFESELIRTDESLYGLAAETVLSQLETALTILRQNLPQKSKAIDYDELEARLIEAFTEGISKWKDSYKEILASTVEAGYKTQMRMVFDPVHREALSALQEQTASSRKAILASRGIDSFSNISRSTTDDIMKRVETGVKEGLTLSEITRSIAGDFKEVVPRRAKTIARTETLTAMSVGQDSAVKNAAKVIPNAVKVWISSKNDAVRDSHEDIHGAIVKVNEKFKLKGRKNKITEMNVPRDPKVKDAPEEIINCRCTVAIVDAEDVDQINV
jgi:HK97 family phage portal protein